MAILARHSITLASVVDLKEAHQYYLLQSSSLGKPGPPTTYPPTGGWTTAEPGYTAGSTNTLYTVMVMVFSNDTFEYLPVQTSSSYEAAKQAYNAASAATQSAGNAWAKAVAAQDSVDNLQIGGRNLLIRSGELVDSYIPNQSPYLPMPSPASRVNAVMAGYIPVIPGEELMLTKGASAADDGGYWRYTWHDASEAVIARSASISDHLQLTVPSNATLMRVSYPYDAYPKIERGNKATDWTPAPEDVDAGIADAAQAAADAAGLAERGLNLVNNTSRSGTADRWTSSLSSTNLTVETVDFNGTSIQALAIDSTGSAQIYSDYFDVDVTKAYEIRFWALDPMTATSTQFYFGMNTVKRLGGTATVSATPVGQAGNAGTPSTNLYFYYNSGATPEWKEFVGYLLPYGVDPAIAKGLGKNVIQNVILSDPSTNQARMRVLNWSNGSNRRTLHIAHMSVTETTAEAIVRARAAQSAAESAQSTADAKITTYYGTGTPSNPSVGDLWLNTGVTPKRLQRWAGSPANWQDVTDTILQEAIEAADQAQFTADGKVRTFAQTSAPTGLTAKDVGDLWVDTDDKNKLYRWQIVSGSTHGWVSIQDELIAEHTQEISDLNSTATALGKRVTVSTSAAPSSAAGYASNDVWEQHGGTPRKAIGRWVVVGSQWVKTGLGPDFIGENAIGTAQVIELNVGKLSVSGPADFNSSFTENLTANTGFINQLTVNKLMIGDRSNLIENPVPTANTGWNDMSYASGYIYHTGTAAVVTGNSFPIQARQRISISLQAYNATTLRTLRIRLARVNESGGVLGYTNVRAAANLPSTNTWHTLDYTLNVPTGGLYRLEFLLGAGTTQMRYRNLQVGAALQGTIIEQGTITGDKFVANVEISAPKIIGGVVEGAELKMTQGNTSVTIGRPAGNALIEFSYSDAGYVGRIGSGPNYMEMNSEDILGLNAGGNIRAVSSVGVLLDAGYGGTPPSPSSGYIRGRASNGIELLRGSDEVFTSNGSVGTQISYSSSLMRVTTNGAYIDRQGDRVFDATSGSTQLFASGSSPSELTLTNASLSLKSSGVDVFTASASAGTRIYAQNAASGTNLILTGATAVINSAGGSAFGASLANTAIAFGNSNVTLTSSSSEFYAGTVAGVSGTVVTITGRGPATTRNSWDFRSVSTGSFTKTALRFNGGSANMPTTTIANNLYMHTDGYVYVSSSSAKNKVDIQNVGTDPLKVLDVDVRDWFDREEAESYSRLLDGDEDAHVTEGPFRRIPGVVAEELEVAGLQQFVTYDSEGEPNGVLYDRLALLLIPVVRDLKAEVEDLRATLQMAG